MEERFQILCYGDSNTWGCIGRWEESEQPEDRYDHLHRWPGVLQQELGNGFHVIEEGLCGRTTIYSPPETPWYNGEPYLLPCLRTHSPLDLVILMLGTNDLLHNQQMTQEHLGDGITRLLEIIRENPKWGRGAQSPNILLLAPIPIAPSSPQGRVLVYPKFRGEIGRELSLHFPKVYAEVAAKNECWFLNAADYAEPCAADGVHMDTESHVRLGKAVAKFLKEKLDNLDGSGFRSEN